MRLGGHWAPVAGQARGGEGERARHGREVCGDAASGAPEV